MKTRLELMKEYAMKENLIIHQATDLTEPLDVEVDEIDEIVEDLIIEHQEEAIRRGVQKDFIVKMEQRLCEFGGEGLAFDKDEYAELIYEEGQLWDGSDILFAEMPIGKCHQNACQLYIEHKNDSRYKDTHLVVGYALSEYGFWFAHTWLVTKDETEQPIVLETCAPSILYYGVILTEAESSYFIMEYSTYND